MLSFLLAPLAAAGTVVVDARIPVEVWLADRLVGEVAMPAELHVPADVGPVEVTLMIGGKPVKETVEVPATGAALVIVGRTGVTTGVREMPVAVAASASSQVEFRSAAREDIVLVIGTSRHTLSPGAAKKFDVPIGQTALSLRDASGTIVWAHGKLEVGGDGLVVQVADGRLPETAGAGSFHPDP